MPSYWPEPPVPSNAFTRAVARFGAIAAGSAVLALAAFAVIVVLAGAYGIVVGVME